MKKEQFTEKEAKDLINGKLSRYFGVAPSEARKDQLYKAVVMSVRDIMLEKRHAFSGGKKIFRQYRIVFVIHRSVHFYIMPCTRRITGTDACPDFGADRTSHAVFVKADVERPRERRHDSASEVFLKISVFARSVGGIVVKRLCKITGGEINIENVALENEIIKETGMAQPCRFLFIYYVRLSS